MYRIQTKGYETKEKITIARDYLLPKIRDQVKFVAEEILIPDDTLQYIISTAHLTKNESGVRNLKRCLEIIYTKLNLYRLVKPGNSMFEKDLGMNVRFPITITRKEVDIFIKNNETTNPSILAMYL
jgi:ATP-dependent Lon protease